MSKAEARRHKQAKRELENLERGLRRGSVELTLDALAALPPGAATEHVAAARQLLVPRLAAACRARDGAALQIWLRALGRRAELLEWLGAADDETIWVLLWTAVRARQYGLAEQLFGLIAARVQSESPRLAAAIEALLGARGEPDPSLIPILPAAGDERLGIEPVKPRRDGPAAPPPTEPGAAAQQLIELRAVETWQRFAATAEQWLSRASSACAARLCPAAAELALLQFSEAAGSSADRCNQAALLVLAAHRRHTELRTSGEVPLDEDESARLDQALLLVLRAALGELWRPGAGTAGGAWISAVIRRALSLPALRPALVSSLSEAPSCGTLAPLADLLCELHAEAPSPSLWMRAAIALDVAAERRVGSGHRPASKTWSWIEANVAAHLGAPRELARSLAALHERDRFRLFDILEEVLPPRKARDLIVALWGFFEGRQREPLISLARSLMARAAGATFCEECGVYHFDEDEGDLPASFSALSAMAQELFLSLEPLVLPHDEGFLSLALSRARDRREQRAVLDRYLAPGVPIDNYLEALLQARRLGLPPKPLRQRLRDEFAGKVVPLARAFELAFSEFGPRSTVCKDLAELFVEAAAETRPESLPANTRRRLEFARVLVRRASKRPRKKQLELALGGDP